jgi:hypothetical protein
MATRALCSRASPLPVLARPHRPATVRTTANASQSSGGQEHPESVGVVSTSKLVSPWVLMGRGHQEASLPFDEAAQQAMNLAAAALKAGTEVEEFSAKVDGLLAVAPFLRGRLPRMRPSLLVALASDVQRFAVRLVCLKDLIPGADVAAIVSMRPSLLLDGEFERIPAALEGLKRYFDEEDVARMTSLEPLLLVEDIEAVLKELERLVPGDEFNALRNAPQIASQVCGLRGLSLW